MSFSPRPRDPRSGSVRQNNNRSDVNNNNDDNDDVGGSNNVVSRDDEGASGNIIAIAVAEETAQNNNSESIRSKSSSLSSSTPAGTGRAFKPRNNRSDWRGGRGGIHGAGVYNHCNPVQNNNNNSGSRRRSASSSSTAANDGDGYHHRTNRSYNNHEHDDHDHRQRSQSRDPMGWGRNFSSYHRKRSRSPENPYHNVGFNRSIRHKSISGGQQHVESHGRRPLGCTNGAEMQMQRAAHHQPQQQQLNASHGRHGRDGMNNMSSHHNHHQPQQQQYHHYQHRPMNASHGRNDASSRRDSSSRSAYGQVRVRAPQFSKINDIQELIQTGCSSLSAIHPSNTAAFWNSLAKQVGMNNQLNLSYQQMNSHIIQLFEHTRRTLGSFGMKDLTQITYSMAKLVDSLRKSRDSTSHSRKDSIASSLSKFLLNDDATTINKDVFLPLANASVRKLDQFDARCLSNLAYAYALIDFVPKVDDGSDLFDHISVQSIEMRAEFNAQDASNMVWAFATVKKRHDALFEAMGDQVVTHDHLKDFRPQELSNTAWAYATAGVFHPGLFEKMANHIVGLKSLDRFTHPQDVSNTVWAYATAGVNHPQLFEKLANHIVAHDRLRDFKPQVLSNIVWAYATAGVNNPLMFQKVANHIVRLGHLIEFKPQALANTVWAYATAGVNLPSLFEKVASHIAGLDHLGGFKPQNLSNIVWAYATAKVSYPKLFEKIANHIVGLDHLRDFKPQAISNTMWAYAKAKVSNNQELFRRFEHHIAGLHHTRDFSPQALRNIEWAYYQAVQKEDLFITPVQDTEYEIFCREDDDDESEYEDLFGSSSPAISSPSSSMEASPSSSIDESNTATLLSPSESEVETPQPCLPNDEDDAASSKHIECKDQKSDEEIITTEDECDTNKEERCKCHETTLLSPSESVLHTCQPCQPDADASVDDKQPAIDEDGINWVPQHAIVIESYRDDSHDLLLQDGDSEFGPIKIDEILYHGEILSNVPRECFILEEEESEPSQSSWDLVRDRVLLTSLPPSLQALKDFSDRVDSACDTLSEKFLLPTERRTRVENISTESYRNCSLEDVKERARQLEKEYQDDLSWRSSDSDTDLRDELDDDIDEYMRVMNAYKEKKPRFQPPSEDFNPLSNNSENDSDNEVDCGLDVTSVARQSAEKIVKDILKDKSRILHESMPVDVVREMISAKCEGCGRLPVPGATAMNGLDRLFNHIRVYRRNLCDTLCTNCNFSKGTSDPSEWIYTSLKLVQRRRSLLELCGISEEEFMKRVLDPKHYFGDKKKDISATRKGDPQDLERIIPGIVAAIKASNCIYCGCNQGGGIDRVVNWKSYVGSAADKQLVSCCSTCNLHKGSWELFDVLVQATINIMYVAENYDPSNPVHIACTTPIDGMMSFLSKQRKPIKCTIGGVLIMFPSKWTMEEFCAKIPDGTVMNPVSVLEYKEWRDGLTTEDNEKIRNALDIRPIQDVLGELTEKRDLLIEYDERLRKLDSANDESEVNEDEEEEEEGEEEDEDEVDELFRNDFMTSFSEKKSSALASVDDELGRHSFRTGSGSGFGRKRDWRLRIEDMNGRLLANVNQKKHVEMFLGKDRLTLYQKVDGLAHSDTVVIRGVGTYGRGKAMFKISRLQDDTNIGMTKLGRRILHSNEVKYPNGVAITDLKDRPLAVCSSMRRATKLMKVRYLAFKLFKSDKFKVRYITNDDKIGVTELGKVKLPGWTKNFKY